MADRLEDYKAPSWAAPLTYIPTQRVKLANIPTPIHQWKLPGTPDDFQVFIKRDDMTGSTLSGNKSRKLEFILADALQKSCKHVVTVGAQTSNHTRAVSVAAVELGLTPHLFYLSDSGIEDVKYEGNNLITKLVGGNMHLISQESVRTFLQDVRPRLLRHAKKIESETGEKALVIPAGGIGPVGAWGYINAFEEIRNQGVEFDDIVCACGSGSTFVSLCISNYLCGSPYKIHGISIGGTDEVVGAMKMELDHSGITGVEIGDLGTFYADYIGLGYAKGTDSELEFITQTAAETGIILDIAYTGKAAYGFTQLMKNRPEVFKGRRVLFIHTGGIFGIYTDAMTKQLLPFVPERELAISPPVQ